MSAYVITDSVIESDEALTFDQVLDKIAKLQAQKSALEREIKALKVPAKEEMRARRVKSYTTPKGTNAALYEQTRTNADRSAAALVCSPEQITAIFKLSTSESFKVK